jgi:hypothetical protein
MKLWCPQGIWDWSNFYANGCTFSNAKWLRDKVQNTAQHCSDTTRSFFLVLHEIFLSILSAISMKRDDLRFSIS